jgi:hypothetical protein
MDDTDVGSKLMIFGEGFQTVGFWALERTKCMLAMQLWERT